MGSNPQEESISGPDEDVEYMPIETETPSGYRPGGYHPDRHWQHFLRRKISHRAQAWRWRPVRHLAGLGRRARRIRCPQEHSRLFRNLKRGRQLGQIATLPEASASASPVDPLRALNDLFASLQDTFKFTGLKGTHMCLLFEPAMMSLGDTKDASYRKLFQPATARIIAAQLLEAVCRLHENGIAHGGMLMPCPAL
ncbi:Cmgc srpk kinase [Mycena sanguinolenta]|uniref:Cmgc srpk kinase n=1 Tax=Mycena sanguinolenta TaxID=230812 RepID=A0A8H6Z008_9AGAR|nr:Cmgc srpk kinase [Mycena sanguinolenta]